MFEMLLSMHDDGHAPLHLNGSPDSQAHTAHTAHAAHLGPVNPHQRVEATGESGAKID